jgi:F-box domain
MNFEQVLEEILNNLNSTALNNLRTTCRTLNSIINQPKYLKTIKVYIKNTTQLRDILNNNKLDIYNVVYAVKDPEEESNHYKELEIEVKRFIEKYKSTLIQIKLNEICWEFFEILNEPNLKSLTISIHDDDTDAYGINQVLNKCDNLNNLRKLKIKALHDKDVEYFIEKLLKKCPNLNYIRLPMW